MVHKTERRSLISKTVKETEAESVAFIVAKAIGLEPGSASADYSYIAATPSCFRKAWKLCSARRSSWELSLPRWPAVLAAKTRIRSCSTGNRIEVSIGAHLLS